MLNQSADPLRLIRHTGLYETHCFTSSQLPLREQTDRPVKGVHRTQKEGNRHERKAAKSSGPCWPGFPS